ncbi:MAG: inorganic phosphate transporter [Bacteroidota bacterium]
MFGLPIELTILLIFCLVAAAAFEFINGFHDTANAVATVIYTHSLKPVYAVIWSGLWNFIGVYVGGVAVAMGIIALLPLEMLVDQNLWHNMAMILALILTAIAWNLGTWRLGIPCSSSHTLLGSIFGVGIAFMFLPGSGAVALNWGKVEDVGLSLMISPLFGFGLAMGLMLLLKKIVRNKKALKAPPAPNTPPPFWVRAILVLTCTSVSFSHGSNDGQKGVGLVMIILIAMAPAYFAIDQARDPQKLYSSSTQIHTILNKIDSTKLTDETTIMWHVLKKRMSSFEARFAGINNYSNIKSTDYFNIRKDILTINSLTGKLIKAQPNLLSSADKEKVKSNLKEFKASTEYVPGWVILMISLSLGLGTMIGWKRIVVTIGERIGKTPLTYAQGASAELVAASTILASTSLGLPVSTTHVLSSGVAGTMVAGAGLKNLRKKTVRSILTAWLITLPVTILMSGLLFLLLRWVFGMFA